MPTALAPLTITAGQTYTTSVGTQGTVGAIVALNESPYAVQVSAGSGSVWIMAQMADRVNCNSMAFNGALTLTVSNYLSGSASAPSFVVYLVAYAPGEAIPGTYPCALPRMLNVGNTVTTTAGTLNVEQDLLTPLILEGCRITGTVGQTRLTIGNGIALQQQADNSLARVLLPASGYTLTAPPPTYSGYGLFINSTGALQVVPSNGGSQAAPALNLAFVAVNASTGAIVSITDLRPLSTTFLSLMNGQGGTLTLPVTTDVLGGVSASGAMSFDNGALTSNGAGVVTATALAAQTLTANAPVKLAAGIQETGYVVISAIATGINQQIFDGINFKTMLTNMPTGITFTKISSSNVTAAAPTSGNYDVTGCTVGIIAAAAGPAFWVGTYTTIGN